MFPFQRGSVSSTVAESHKKNRKIRQKKIFWEKTRFFVIHTSNHCMAVFYVTLRTYCCSAITSMRACSLSVAGKFYKATPTYPLVVTQCALLPSLHFCIHLFCLFSIPLISEPITTQLYLVSLYISLFAHKYMPPTKLPLRIFFFCKKAHQAKPSHIGLEY